MKLKTLIATLVCIAVGLPSSAQDKQLMTDYQSRLQQFFAEVYEAPSDNLRYHANEMAVQLFAEALAAENSIRWEWDFGQRVSVLTSSDRKFRIVTWPVVNDAGEYECFGFIQALNEKTGEYDLYELNDKSEDIVNRQETMLTPDNWYGAVYQELITTTHEGKTFYTLLGWSGVDCLTQRKVIEPVCFKGGSSMPQFGQALFRKERNLRRVVLEYTDNAMVNLRYEEQFVRKVERVRAKRVSRSSRRKRGKNATAQEKVVSAPTAKVRDEKMRMIIFDEVAPQVAGMEGLFQYYVPSGAELAYVWGNGKWELRSGAQGRVKDKRLNKEFKPMEKPSPSYQFRTAPTPR